MERPRLQNPYHAISVAASDGRSAFSPSSWLSWLMNRKEMKTIPAPIQYMALEYCAYCTISPMRESGMVMDRPTVTTSGVVRSMA